MIYQQDVSFSHIRKNKKKDSKTEKDSRRHETTDK